MLRAVVTLRIERPLAPIARSQRDGRSFGFAIKPAMKREVPLDRRRPELLPGGLESIPRTEIGPWFRSWSRPASVVAIQTAPSPYGRALRSDPGGQPSRPGAARLHAPGPPIAQALVLKPGHR